MNTFKSRNGRWRFTIIDFIDFIAALAIIVIVGTMIGTFVFDVLLSHGSIKIGTGEKRGIIVKAATEGFWNPTHEAELIRGGMNGGSGGFGTTPFHFTYSQSQASNVEAFMSSGAEVIVTYKRPFWVWRWQSDSGGVFLTDIHSADIRAAIPTAESLSGTRTVDNH